MGSLVKLPATVEADHSLPPKSPTNVSTENSISNNDSSWKEPIAVIGLALNLPGDANSPDAFWDMLSKGKSTRSVVPADRFNIDSFYHDSEENKPDMINHKHGHFLNEDIAAFDAPFFSMPPEEVASMDPMQRWLLEVSYKAFENAGLSIQALNGTNTSVHIGSFTRDYDLLLNKDHMVAQRYRATGVSPSFLADRISWFYNLKGPSLSVDTACSSSMSALHIACQAIHAGDSAMGVVGGCNLIINPETSGSLANLNFTSRDGTSYSFDHRANGYSRGEGFGVIIIQSLSQALKDGNTIRAVIRATSANQDGRMPGITQPSAIAQEQMIRRAYNIAGLDMSKTAFVEAHGTGTALGDPTEARAIGNSFDTPREHGGPLYIGALKSNFGHLEGGSGIVAVIKTILALEKAIIPPNICFEKLNPNIDTKKLNLKFPLSLTPWPTGSQNHRRASINSFGVGGANAHAVLDDAYNYLRRHGLSGKTNLIGPVVPNGDQKHRGHNVKAQIMESQLLLFSAAEQNGLERVAKSYREYLGDLNSSNGHAFEFIANLAFTLSAKRTQFPWKFYTVVSSAEELGRVLNNKIQSPVQFIRDPALCFVFNGQGAQWWAMGRELFLYPAFRRSLNESDRILQSFGCPWSLIEELFKDENNSNVNDPRYSQPMCTTLQIALVKLLTSWKVLPSAVIGHSSGEIAAAYCIGGLSHQSACKVAYLRGVASGFLVANSDKSGVMMAVGLTEMEILKYISNFQLQQLVTISCYNSPRSLTLSGDPSSMNILESALKKDGIFAKILQVPVAYHSEQMSWIADEYLYSMGSLEAGLPLTDGVSMYSTTTTFEASIEEVSKASYWVQNMVSPVQFSRVFGKLISQRFEGKEKERISCYLEIGPHSTLRGPIMDNIGRISKGRKPLYSSILIRNKSALKTAMNTAGNLFSLGFGVDINAVNNPNNIVGDRSMLVDLPPYPFNHTKRYWLESRFSKGHRFRQFPPNEYLGTQVSDWNPLEARWRHIIKSPELKWVEDHKINDDIIFPAAGMLVMAIEASNQINSHSDRVVNGFKIRDVKISKALRIPRDKNGVEVEFYLKTNKEVAGRFLVWSLFRLCAYDHTSEEWSEICQGQVASEYRDQVDQGMFSKMAVEKAYQYTASEKRCNTLVSFETIYQHFSRCGVNYGPSFQSLRDIRCNKNGESIASMDLHHWAQFSSSGKPQVPIIHPAALDGLLHLSVVCATDGGNKVEPIPLPTIIRTLWISAASQSPDPDTREQKVLAYSNSSHYGSKYKGSYFALDATTKEPICIGEFLSTFAGVSTSQSREDGTFEVEGYSHKILWKPDPGFLLKKSRRSYFSAEKSFVAPVADFLQREKENLILLSLDKLQKEISYECVQQQSPYLQKYFIWAKSYTSKHKEKLDALLREDESIQTLSARVEQNDPEGQLIVRVLRNLACVLRGTISALEILFHDDLATRYYQFHNNSKPVFSDCMKFVDALAHKQPTLKVLEIGAGTGSATAGLLETLSSWEDDSGDRTKEPRYSDYTFTDISPSFFESARERFTDHHDKMIFSTLDIERSPCEQGFERNVYDVVMASNVLHATASLKNALQNIRELLKPDGVMILCEDSPENAVNSFIFGLLPGWWLGTEKYREHGPLVTRGTWNTLIGECGFTGIDLVFPHADNHDGNVMISRACSSSEAQFSRVDLSNESFIILKKNDSLAQSELAEKLLRQMTEAGHQNSSICTFEEVQSRPELVMKAFCISLLEFENSLLYQIESEEYVALKHICLMTNGIIWISQSSLAGNPTSSMINGLARTLRYEHPQKKFVTLTIQEPYDLGRAVDSIYNVLDATTTMPIRACEPEFKDIDGTLHINRVLQHYSFDTYLAGKEKKTSVKLAPFGEDSRRSLKLTLATPGVLSSFQFADDTNCSMPLGQDEVEIRVKASGLNFRDVLDVLGQVETGGLGGECSGVINRLGQNAAQHFKIGDRVISCCDGSIATYARSKSYLTVSRIPDSMSFTTAAGLPTVFLTAYHTIMDVARIKPGESILIHSAAGGFGQACVQLAQLRGAEIFATVSSEEKRRLLTTLYGIKEDHIFSSRTSAFVDGVKRIKKGCGVDVIVNTLAGEALRDTWECIGHFGRFIEVGKKDISNLGTLPMFPFSRSVSFTSVDLQNVIAFAPGIIHEQFPKVMSLFRENKISIPSPLQIFRGHQVEDAFRLLQSGKSMGKLVIEIQDSDIVPIIPKLEPTYYFDENATYLIAGGLGGLGRSIAQWMVNRHAKHLILLSRFQQQSEAAKIILKQFAAQGIEVATPFCDVSKEEELRSALEQCKSMPPIKGCIQASMILHNVTFAKMSLEDFKVAVKPKVDGSWNLHSMLPKNLDFFILLSSMAGLIGLHGQANYACGNVYQDALAEYRVEQGEKAISIDLGLVSEVGYVAEKRTGNKVLTNQDYPSVSEQEIHNTLEYYCNPSLPVQVGSNCQVLLGRVRSGNDSTAQEPYWMQLPMFRSLRQRKKQSVSHEKEAPVNYRALINACESQADAADIIANGLRDKLSRTLVMEKEDIDIGRPMNTYGIDSLSAVEIRMWFQNIIGADVTIFEILGDQSMSTLAARTAGRCNLLGPGT